MNIFRLAGDLSHLLAIIILLLKIWNTRSCAGKSSCSWRLVFWPVVAIFDLKGFCWGNILWFYVNLTEEEWRCWNLGSFSFARYVLCHFSRPNLPRQLWLNKLDKNTLMTRFFSGISGKSQILFAIVYSTRYLDLLTTYVSLYNSFMKLIFISASYATVFLIYRKFKATYDSNHDTFRIEFLVLPALILALLIHHSFTVLEVSNSIH